MALHKQEINNQTDAFWKQCKLWLIDQKAKK